MVPSSGSTELDMSDDGETDDEGAVMRGGALRKLESEVLVGGGGDLFSEIHLNELKKLERRLEEAETQKVSKRPPLYTEKIIFPFRLTFNGI